MKDEPSDNSSFIEEQGWRNDSVVKSLAVLSRGLVFKSSATL